MDWQGDKFIAKVERKARRNVEAACIHTQNQAKVLISTPSRTVTYVQRVNLKTGVRGGMKKVLGPRGSDRSKPGEAPHKDYGTLRSSIAHEMQEGASGIVGTALAYGKYLELGAPRAHLAPRPWLRRTLLEEKPVILEIVTEGIAMPTP